jgi:hypothetical protein
MRLLEKEKPWDVKDNKSFLSIDQVREIARMDMSDILSHVENCHSEIPYVFYELWRTGREEDILDLVYFAEWDGFSGLVDAASIIFTTGFLSEKKCECFLRDVVEITNVGLIGLPLDTEIDLDLRKQIDDDVKEMMDSILSERDRLSEFINLN